MKQANTLKQRLTLLNKHTNDKYEVLNNKIMGYYAIIKNGEKHSEYINENHLRKGLGKICYTLGLTDLYSNILV